ncbi:hypothetical protein FQA39_LY11583 [Lamprigera yunnana]|nr:hypothetical protein FQA39_LY11583 [Lamprigera yunnana]
MTAQYGDSCLSLRQADFYYYLKDNPVTFNVLLLYISFTTKKFHGEWFRHFLILCVLLGGTSAFFWFFQVLHLLVLCLNDMHVELQSFCTCALTCIVSIYLVVESHNSYLFWLLQTGEKLLHDEVSPLVETELTKGCVKFIENNFLDDCFIVVHKFTTKKFHGEWFRHFLILCVLLGGTSAFFWFFQVLHLLVLCLNDMHVELQSFCTCALTCIVSIYLVVESHNSYLFWLLQTGEKLLHDEVSPLVETELTKGCVKFIENNFLDDVSPV